jgi:hypothetical protein
MTMLVAPFKNLQFTSMFQILEVHVIDHQHPPDVIKDSKAKL